MKIIKVIAKNNLKEFEDNVNSLLKNGFVIIQDSFRVNDVCLSTYEATYFYCLMSGEEENVG